MLTLLIKSIFSVCYLYFILISIIIVLYKLFLFSPLILNIFLMLLLFLGIIKDQRFSWFRKSIFILLIILQIFVYYYIGIIPILILKDLFWFSVVINVSFIWHNLFIIWLYDLFKSLNNNYMCYIISRIGLLTSLSIINIILSSLLMMVEKILEYYCLVNDVGITKKKPFFLQLIITILVALYKANSYFIKFFSIYSLFIMGKIKNNLQFNFEFFKRILFFILFLILSFILGTPRIYLIWIYYSIYDILLNLRYAFLIWFRSYNVIKNLTFLNQFKSFYLYDIEKESFLKYWKLMDHDIYYDYYGFLENCSWSPVYLDTYLYDINDVLSLFIYEPNYRLFLYVKHIGFKIDDCSSDFSDIELQDFINFYNIHVTLDVYHKIYKEFYDKNEFKFYNLDLKGWNFIKYMIGLPKGRYHIKKNYYDH